MGEDELEADFDNEESDDEANVGFEVDFSEEVEDGREEDGNGNPGVI